MIEVLEPRNAMLKQFVDSIYVLRKGPGRLEFTAYPSTNIPVGLFRNTELRLEPERIVLDQAGTENYLAMACNPFSGAVHLEYAKLVDEIAINFKPLGFASFTATNPEAGRIIHFDSWNDRLPQLFSDVLAADAPETQLHIIETFLAACYRPLPDEAVLLRAIDMLNDPGCGRRMEAIADVAGIHYKRLYRLFREYVGCSMAHYRNIVKFRASVLSRINNGEKARLVDICYDNGYSDQAYFTREFRRLTGQKPGRFFREVTAFGTDKIVFRIT